MTNIETKHVVIVVAWVLFAGLLLKYAPYLLLAVVAVPAILLIVGLIKEVRE